VTTPKLIDKAPFAIEVRNLSKHFRLYSHPLDRLKEIFFRKSCHQSFAALQDVSFQVTSGEAVGIIGDNGAGKSTLLKIVAGTLSPTDGEIVKQGRVAALLELGAGFHPEFTGRQNICLNASLLGMIPSEIQEREKDIIAFSGLQEVIDRPVKTYSSGMYVRLACSHSMYQVNHLCPKAIWIHSGRIRAMGKACEITAAYENYTREQIAQDKTDELSSLHQEVSSSPIFVSGISLNGDKGPLSLRTGDSLEVKISYESTNGEPFWPVAGIRRNDDLVCQGIGMASQENTSPLQGPGKGHVKLHYHSLPFLHGEFSVVVFLVDKSGLHVYARKESAPFVIQAPSSWNIEMGLLALECTWETDS
jgi:ABC-type polysaccharide/polyol phosphate transport system ATPase subunit